MGSLMAGIRSLMSLLINNLEVVMVDSDDGVLACEQAGLLDVSGALV
jgi:hypothetical protein